MVVLGPARTGLATINVHYIPAYSLEDDPGVDNNRNRNRPEMLG